MSVDFPEPDGPHTTTTSPLVTWVVQSTSTCLSPYHLLTFLISIMAIIYSLNFSRATKLVLEEIVESLRAARFEVRLD